MTSEKKLKSGYSTGSHASAALKAALLSLFSPDISVEKVKINLPDYNQLEFSINKVVKTFEYVIVSVIKSDNDDYDVTKGCNIICNATLIDKKELFVFNKTDHKPYHFEFNGINLYIWAGRGLGVVTKTGLNAKVGYPSINPIPLAMMQDIFQEAVELLQIPPKTTVNLVFEVVNGELIANNTANPKVGIIGGISFLGKKGIVKPISTDAYLESLKNEISVASFNPSKTIVFTIGNSSLKFAKYFYKLEKECFIETGNFVFDSLKIIQNYNFSKIIFVANIGKLTKIAQYKKNTNNKFGYINFTLLQSWLEKQTFPEIIITISNQMTTVGALEEFINVKYPKFLIKFHQLICEKALNTIKNWCEKLNLRNLAIEVLLTDGEILKYSSKIVI